MSKKIAVLGAGNIGKFIGEYLSNNTDLDVTIFDVSQDVLNTVSCHSHQADLSNELVIKDAVKNSDIVINALPSFLGYNALKVSILNGKHVVDFSYMTQDPRQLDALAKEKGVTVVTDFGFAPGICHMFVGRALKLLGKGIDTTIYVGGLPIKEADEYKEVFSARDVLEEYSRPARSISAGKVVTEVPFDRNIPWNNILPGNRAVSLSGFVSDGLRTMLDLEGIDNMVESTLRYVKHFDKMVGLKEDGFFLPGNVDNTAKVLSEKWKRSSDDRDMSILNVVSNGPKGEVDHLLYDEYDEKNKVHSMARATGFPVILMALMIASGEFNRTGVNIPEILGQDDNVFTAITVRLKDLGIHIDEKIVMNKAVSNERTGK